MFTEMNYPLQPSRESSISDTETTTISCYSIVTFIHFSQKSFTPFLEGWNIYRACSLCQSHKGNKSESRKNSFKNSFHSLKFTGEYGIFIYHKKSKWAFAFLWQMRRKPMQVCPGSWNQYNRTFHANSKQATETCPHLTNMKICYKWKI